MNDLIGPLGLPGAAVALLTCVLVGIKIAHALRPPANGNGNGVSAQLAKLIAEQTTVLQTLGSSMGALAANMGHLATKDDVRQFTEQNRHAAAAIGDKAIKAVETQVGAACEAADMRDQAMHQRFDAIPDLVAARIK